MRAATAHAVDVHGHTDDDDLRSALRASLVPDVPPITLNEGAFVQVIEFRTSRLPEFQEIEDRWRDAIGSDRTARWAITGADRATPGRYVQIVGFPTTNRRWPTRSTPSPAGSPSSSARCATVRPSSTTSTCDGCRRSEAAAGGTAVSAARGSPGCSGTAPASCRSPRPSPSRPTPASSARRGRCAPGRRSRRRAPCRGGST